MNNKIKIALTLIALLVVVIIGFRVYLWYHDQSSNYVRFEGKDNKSQLIEFKPSLFMLRENIDAHNISRDQAILKLLASTLEGSTVTYTNCRIVNIYGNIESYLLAQVRCEYEV